MSHEELKALVVETLFDLVPPEMKADVARVIHHIQNHLASIEMAGEMLASGDLSAEESLMLERLRSECVSEIVNLVRNVGPTPHYSSSTGRRINVNSVA
jgi:hypothetical protein